MTNELAEYLNKKISRETINKTLSVIQAMKAGAGLKNAVAEQQLGIAEFFDAVHTHSDLEKLYTDAQSSRAEILVEEIVDISDMEEDPQRARIRLDARRWYASKMKPKKYGDKIDVNVSGSINIHAALTEARKRVLLPDSYQADVIDAQVIDTTNELAVEHTDTESVAEPAKDDKDIDINDLLE